MMNRRQFFRTSAAAAAAFALPVPRLYALDGSASQAAGGIAAVRLDGSATVIEQAALAELKAALRGPLLLAGDPGYDAARRVLNESIDLHPAVVVQPTGAADVAAAVRFARERELLLAVKCGGHSPSGKSTCEKGLQLDLSRLRGVRVDPKARRAFVEGGSLLGEVDHEAMAQGLVTTCGTVSHTGVGGLTLGGGFGRLARRFGLALDNVRSLDVVTADGMLRHASAEENPDLYWALRGGGGNFGVVTNFEFELHPMQREVVAGAFVFPFERARELLAFYGDYTANVPEEMQVDFFMQAPRAGKPPVAVIACCWSGAAGQAEAALAPVRKLGKPLADTVKAQDYCVVQRSNDNLDPRSEGTYLKSGFINGFPAGLADTVIDNFRADPARSTSFFVQQAGGAIGRVATDATAFPHRRATHGIFTTVAWSLADDRAPHVAACREYWAKLEPMTDGYYTNETGDEGQRRIDDNYQGNLPKLREVKRRYDPANLFRLNANVQPA
ncbi:MAG TPA: FAD-binding oxidoreductase [Steroidobacteraceae bacterium]|nr:FAD-binding oxidoreductase [Steroidobacteraceae bacterium]